MGCGAKLYSYEIDEHKTECPNYEEFCEKCEQFFKPNQEKDLSLAKHDCITLLRKRFQERQQEEKLLNLKLGTNYDRVNVCCTQGHQLKVQRGWICQLIRDNRMENMVCRGC